MYQTHSEGSQEQAEAGLVDANAPHGDVHSPNLPSMPIVPHMTTLYGYYDKRKHIRFGCSECPLDGVHKGKLQTDLLSTFYWSGSFCKDYFFFVANWHPLLGIFLCHPHHPWTRGERCLMLLHSFTFMFLTLSFGCNAEVAGKLWLLSLVVNVLECIYVTILYQVSTLDTYCQWTRGGCCVCSCFCQSIRCCWRLGKTVALFQATMLALGTAFFSVGFIDAAHCDTGRVAQQFAQSCLQSYLIWFPMYLFLPCIGFLHVWRCERKKIDRQAANAAATAGMSVAGSTGAGLLAGADLAELFHLRHHGTHTGVAERPPGQSSGYHPPFQHAATAPVQR